MMRKISLHLTFFVLLAFNFTHLRSQVSYRKEILDRIVKVEHNLNHRIQDNAHGSLTQRMAMYNVTGLSIAVIHNYEIEWVKGYGYADKEEGKPVTTETLFQAASISKSINGVGVLKLAQDKKINLDGDINTYLSSWKFPYKNSAEKITVSNLLDHSAGLSVHGFPGYMKGQHLPSTADILNGNGDAVNAPVRSETKPGSSYRYSGGGTTISQLIVTDVTNQPYEDYMWENVLQPLGMTNSFFNQNVPLTKQSLLATAYVDGVAVSGKYHIYPEQAAAGLWTNPTDLAKYVIETQLALKGQSQKVLDQEMTIKRLTPTIANSAQGVFLEKKGDATYFFHSGSNEGFGAYYYGSLEDGNGVVVMSNSGFSPLLFEVINSVAKVYEWRGFIDKEASAGIVKKPVTQ
jgi:CubicO group peptidase (beta-lactamase class C family)